MIIGKTIKANNLKLRFNKKLVGDIPIEALSTKAPLYNRKWSKSKIPNKEIKFSDLKKIKF